MIREIDRTPIYTGRSRVGDRWVPASEVVAIEEDGRLRIYREDTGHTISATVEELAAGGYVRDPVASRAARRARDRAVVR